MEAKEISIEPREKQGSSQSRRMRRDGFIPTAVYGRGEKSLLAQIPEREFTLIAAGVRSSQLFTLKSGNSQLNGRSALVKEIQRDFISGAVLHVDFQALHENEEIDVEIPLRFVGEAPGVKTDGGILTITSHEITVACLPKMIPTDIEVDVSSLKIGDSIHARELKLPQGVRLHQNVDETIVSVVLARQLVEETTTAAAATPEGAAAAAPGAEGAAAAPAAAAAAPQGDKKAAGAEKKPAEGKK